MAIYVPDVPQGNQQINNTTTAIEGNFEYINSLIGVNHIPFNTVDDFGKHLFLDYIQQSIAPSTSSTEMAMFSMFSTSTNQIELFARYPNNGAIVQITNTSSTVSDPAGGQYNGGYNSSGFQYGAGFWQSFPGGGFMLFGSTSTSYAQVGNASTINIYYPVATGIPTFSKTPYTVYLFNGNQNTNSSGNSQGFYGTQSINTNYFTVYNNPKSTGWSANWLAIGV